MDRLKFARDDGLIRADNPLEELPILPGSNHLFQSLSPNT